jgi:hypothetical protein
VTTSTVCVAGVIAGVAGAKVVFKNLFTVPAGTLLIVFDTAFALRRELISAGVL